MAPPPTNNAAGMGYILASSINASPLRMSAHNPTGLGAVAVTQYDKGAAGNTTISYSDKANWDYNNWQIDAPSKFTGGSNILRTDDTSSLDELGYTFFNDTGLPDDIPPNSLGRDDLQEYSFSAGIKDDGIGDALDEFISFQIKIVMQGTDAANPPRIKDLRAIALAT